MGRPSYGQIGRFYLPLAANGLLMTLQQPVVTAGIARTADAGAALAAYGVALNIAVLLESPVQMLLPTANAVVQDRRSYRLLRRFTIFTGLALSGLLLLVATSPLGPLTVSRLIGVPPAVARQVFPTLLVMALWPLAVGWRRFYQGLLIRRGHTRAIGYATACRLLTITAVVILAVSRYDLPGALVGGLALMAGAVAEAAVVTARALFVMRAGFQSKGEMQPPVGDPSTGPSTGSGHRFAALARFYLPLATTSVLTIATWPLIAAGISRVAEPVSALAAWPVALSVLWLLTTPIQMLQQVSIALIRGSRSQRTVVESGLTLGLLGSLLLASCAFTPLIGLFLRYIVAAPTEVAPLAISAARILSPLPLLVAGQSLLQGLLISRGATGGVRLAIMANPVVLGLLLLSGIAYGRLPGAALAPIAMTGGLLAETTVLWWKFKGFEHTSGGCRGEVCLSTDIQPASRCVLHTSRITHDQRPNGVSLPPLCQYHAPVPAETLPPPGDRTACRRNPSIAPPRPRGCGPSCTVAHRRWRRRRPPRPAPAPPAGFLYPPRHRGSRCRPSAPGGRG